ncbi:MAG: 50S ribosomal protein L11 methyltransferase [Alphaproteobacteria bacterium]|nr:50S ribosomal protein L11 methyltransferase [Alphaproteobacteria bacterium]
MVVGKAWFTVAAADRAGWENALEERLVEAGFVVTSCETTRDGPWRIEIFGDADAPLVAGAITAASRMLGAVEPDWHWETLPEIDWVAENQRSFQPFAVGPFWVHPSHNAGDPPAGRLLLEIDAGLAFGTGTHATTRGCLEMLATLDVGETQYAADVGCGSGILTIAMAKLWRRPVIGGDNDVQAIEVASENARLNGVGDLCRFVHAVGLGAAELQMRAPYDLIVANILADPLTELSDSFVAALRPGGRALLSGLLVEQVDHILSVYARRGLTLERQLDREKGGAQWRTLLLRR